MQTLLDQIDALLDDPEGDLGRLERTLTDGYAMALALEADRWRVEKRLVADALARGAASPKGRRLASLATQLERQDEELSDLRGRLVRLRKRVAEARRAA